MRTVGWLVAPLFLLGASPAELTGWECTTDSLVSGERCVFQGAEVEGAKADPKANVQAMTDLAKSLCALHLAPSERNSSTDAVEAHCKTEVATVAKDACASRGPLVDDQGRFVPSAKGCYRALTEVRQHTEWQASTLAPCCACLAAQHCVAAANKCVESAQAQASVEAANARCALASCESACVGLLPESDEAPEPSGSTKVSHR